MGVSKKHKGRTGFSLLPKLSGGNIYGNSVGNQENGDYAGGSC